MVALQPNDQIGAYRVVRPLGKGGMGSVYEVVHVKLGVHYALKTFTLDHGYVELLKERFMAEGRVLARLRHPNLVRVFDLDIDKDLHPPCRWPRPRGRKDGGEEVAGAREPRKKIGREDDFVVGANWVLIPV